MLDNYLEKMNIQLNDLKDYIYKIDEFDETIEECFLLKQLKEKINNDKQRYLSLAIHHLIHTKNLREIENNLIMMNYLFDKEKEYREVKIQIKKFVLSINKPIDQYRILRHIMNLNTRTLIKELVKHHYLNLEQAAYISLVEEHVEDAYQYLLLLDHKPKQELLDYFGMHSMTGYYSLKHHYSRKAYQYVLQRS